MTLTSDSGKKRVHIRKQGSRLFCIYVTVFKQYKGDKGQEQVLESKWYKTMAGASRYAKSKGCKHLMK